MNVILDHAGSLTFVTDAPSVAEALREAETNPRIPMVNVAFAVDDDTTADAYAETVAYEVTEIPFAELSSYERTGCQYDECHNLAFGPDYRSETYCDEHAGPVTDEYADVDVIWGGAVDSSEYHLTERAEILRIVADVEEAIVGGNIPSVLNGGAQVIARFHSHEFETREEYDKFDGDCFCESYDTEYDSLQAITPAGLSVNWKDEHNEQICVTLHDGTTLVVANVAEDNEERDRYQVAVTERDGTTTRLTSNLYAPASPGEVWAQDPLGSVADAARALWDAHNEDARKGT